MYYPSWHPNNPAVSHCICFTDAVCHCYSCFKDLWVSWLSVELLETPLKVIPRIFCGIAKVKLLQRCTWLNVYLRQHAKIKQAQFCWETGTKYEELVPSIYRCYKILLTVKPRRIHKNVLYPVREVEGGGGGGGRGAPYERGAVARRKF